MASRWYYAKGVEKHGPLAGREMKQLADSGVLESDDLVWKTGMADWQPARTISGLCLTTQSKHANPAPIPAQNTSSKAKPSDDRSEKSAVAKDSGPAGSTDSPMNSSELHSRAKRIISSSVAAIREKVGKPETQNAVAKFKSICGRLWSGSLNFWIRFSAWYLGVLRRILRASKPPDENVATETFPLGDVTVAEATARATVVPRAALLGKVIHWTVVVMMGAGIVGSIFDLGGGEAEAKVMAETFVQKMLKSPTTADFPSTSEYDAREVDDDQWRVSGYVDAQNSFGATIRTHWTVTIEYDGDGKWSLINRDFSEDSVAGSENSRSGAGVDTTFLSAARRVQGNDGLVMAKMLIELRREDRWSWEQLQEEVDFQFGAIAEEFKLWRESCIAVGDD